MGRSSGGSTGSTSRIIHSGRLPLMRNASTISRRLMARRRFWLVLLAMICLSSSLSLSRSISMRSSLMASAPMPTLKSSGLYLSSSSRYSLSVMTCFLVISVTLPGSSTMNATKYSTCSRSFGEMSSSRLMREGTPRKYHMWDTGVASSMCPILSRRTLLLVTSTPHFSHMTPL